MLDHKTKELSGGQKQRVAIGRAMIRNPKVFLFDEPLSNLDAKLKNSMRCEITKLHKELKATFIYVTHDQIEALSMGDRIAILNKGNMEQFDTPYNLYYKPKNKFVAEFIGVPKINVIKTIIFCEPGFYYFRLFEKNIKLPKENIINTEVIKNNKEYYIGIRSEHFYLDYTSNITVKVDHVENIGSDIYAFTTTKGMNTPVIMRFSTKNNIYPNDILRINLDLNYLYIFNLSDGTTLSFPNLKL